MCCKRTEEAVLPLPGKVRALAVAAMVYFMKVLVEARYIAKKTTRTLLEDTRGEVNIVAMVLIIIVVIALVAIFRSEMTDIVTKMFEKIRSGMDL